MPVLNKTEIRTRLSGKLPGLPAQLEMAPLTRKTELPAESCIDAAVLLLLFPEGDSLSTVFIKRNEYDGPHSAQVSFPGGMHELCDADYASTALRETEEETGAKADQIEILGSLTPLYIPVSNFCVHPFIGWTDSMPDFNPDPTEVQYLICPSIDSLLDHRLKMTGTIEVHGTMIETPYFLFEEEIIWGATAMMLNEFIHLIS